MAKPYVRALALVATAALYAPDVGAQAPPAAARIDVATIGPQPGATVPDFALKDQLGRQRTLASIAGPRGTMLVFSRSADW